MTTSEATPLTEVLPVRNGKRAALRWYPVADSPQAGFVVIDSERASVCYSVTEFPSGWPGRGFYLRKLVPGTDKTSEGYSVFLSHHGPEGDSCECRGASAHGHCKHRDALRALLENLWV